MRIKSILSITMLVCLIAAANYEAKAQCPPEQECDWPGEEDGGGNDDCWYVNCHTEITAQGWNPDGSTWMRVCDVCTKNCQPDENGPIIIGWPDGALTNCYYINRWGSVH